MTNVELLKTIRDALSVAAITLEVRLAKYDKNEPDEEPDTPCPVYDLRTLYADGMLSARATNCLLRAGYETTRQVIDGMETKNDLLNVKNMGPSTAANVLKCFHELGMKWTWES